MTIDLGSKTGSTSVMTAQQNQSDSVDYQLQMNSCNNSNQGGATPNYRSSGSMAVCPRAETPKMRQVKLTNFSSTNEHFDRLHHQSRKPILCKENLCHGAMMAGQSVAPPVASPRSREEIATFAKDFLKEFHVTQEKTSDAEKQQRVADVLKSIETTGTYDLTYDELVFGSKLAWRNAPRCIGRIQWNKLMVFDYRHIKSTDQMFEGICNHIKYASNDGNIRSAITIFPKREVGKPDFRLWNPQLINYAGYQQDDGTVIGDPARVKLTQICEKLGWKGRGGRFDVLPLVLNASGEDPKYYVIPPELVLEVEMKHPEYAWFQDMGLRWYGLPAVADMMFDIGGLEFPAAPFNGWYMSSEIGTRDFCDPHRYNIIDEVAVKMGLDVSSTVNLWKDQALVEINIAVLYSFQSANVTIMDHHTASESFIKHLANEQKLRGGCPADWVWIVPPLSGGITSVFHQEMINYNLKPSYEYQEKAWKTHVWVDKEKEKLHRGSGRKLHIKAAARAIIFASYLMNKYMRRRIKVSILYASETGKSESYAKRIGDIFTKAFNPEVKCMDAYSAKDLASEHLTLVVTSTFGSGEAPDNGKAFSKALTSMQRKSDLNNNNNNNDVTEKDRYLNHVNLQNSTASGAQIGISRFAVFALGSTAYPDFCEFGKFCDASLAAMGCKRLLPVATGDELKGLEQSFRKWAQGIFQAACKEFGIRFDFKGDFGATLEEEDSWSPDLYRLSKAGEQFHDLYEGLSKMHHRTVLPCRMISRTHLQAPDSSRQTILARFDTKGAEEFQYFPGDHLGIFPSNRQELVVGISRRLKNASSLTDVMLVQTVDKENCRSGRIKTWKDAGKMPPCSILTALYHYLDINAPPTQQLLKLLAKCATEEKERLQMEKIAKDDEAYETWRNFKFPNFLEVLQEFPSLRPDAVLLMTQLPLLQPRFYSISSSPDTCLGEIHATVAIVTYRTQNEAGPVHYGVCTHFLNSFPNSEIPCFIRRAENFHMPEDLSKPIVMVGPGTGIAPFRSFWQQREHDIMKELQRFPSKKSWLNFRCANVNAKMEEFGKMTLYFGCRNPKIDHIYQDELAKLCKKSSLFRTRVAFSRESAKPKTYVQHLLKEDEGFIYRHLTKDKGHIYVCGEAGMAAEVRATLKKILRDQGSMQQADVDNFIQEMKEDGRLHEDIFGVLIKSK